MKRYIKANDYDVAFAYEEDQPEFGVMTQDSNSARYNLIVYKDRKTAERWRDKLINDPSYKMFQRALRYAKYDWDACTYYVGGVGSGIGFYDPNESVHGFPVEVSEDMNTITIKPIVLSDGNEQQVFYMNAMGVNPQDPTSLDIVATVISEIVLTKGWNETASVKAVPAAVPSKVKAVTMDGAPVTKAPAARRYKSMTKLEVEPAHEYKYDETPNVVTMDMVEKTSAKILKHFNVQ